MKKLTFFALLAACFSQAQTLYVEGQTLFTASGQELILRGINYPIIDEGSISLSNAAEYQHKIDEAAQTGSNAIRIPWYTNETHWRDNPSFGTPGTVAGYVEDGHLGNLLAYCHSKGMIPILEIHNATCSNNWATFNNVVMPWWEQQVVLDLIEEHKEYLIVNLANEFGYARWTGNTAAGLSVFETNYNAAIASLRDLGVTVPIMVDAPDCGQSSTELLSIAEDMVTADPQHNLIFSSHAYWFGYAQTEALVQQKLDEAQNTDVCFILGEVASTQDGDFCGSLSLADLYPIILEEACEREIGWLAWTYDLDCSAGREMTTDGEFENLTVYGNDLVYNETYGLISGTCSAAQLSITRPGKTLMALAPNPAASVVALTSEEAVASVEFCDVQGRSVRKFTSGFGQMDLSGLASGIYFAKAGMVSGEKRIFRLVKD